MPLRTVSLDELIIDDEPAMEQVPLYPRLKRALAESRHRFCIPHGAAPASWDRVVFLNLTYWTETGADVLCDDHIAADVVAHAAWHEVVSGRLAEHAAKAVPDASAASSPLTLFFGEAIASAFDLYILGRLWRSAPDSDFIATQVPIMSEAAQQAGLSDRQFASLLGSIADGPEHAFGEMRALLFDAGLALLACRDPLEAQTALERFAGQRLLPLLHHYQLSNWILYARAYGRPTAALDEMVRGFDAQLRASAEPLAWLATQFL